MNARMASLMAKAVTGNSDAGGGMVESLLSSFGLSPEKIKAELTQITDAIGAKLQSIDARLASIESKLDLLEQSMEAERLRRDASAVPTLTEMLYCSCGVAPEKDCPIHSKSSHHN